MTVREAVIANGRLERPRSPMEIADALGVSTATVYQATSRARARGEVPVSRRQVTGAIREPRETVSADVATVHGIEEHPLALRADLLLAANRLAGDDDLRLSPAEAEVVRVAGLRLQTAGNAVARLGIALATAAWGARED